MAVPSVSHRNWCRLQGITQFVIGTTSVHPGELSFADQLRACVDYADGVRHNLRNDDLGGYTHAELRTPYTFENDSTGRDRPHRPEVPEELMDDLVEALNNEYPELPVEDMDFNKQMDLLLDPLAKYYRKLDCYLSVNTSSDEDVEGDKEAANQ
ncbi:hypothetical protein GJ629_15635 [Halapricum sp. CBA1109]|uniref:hypothetical protein n=1 Tax=Halapricum sp. CBA1109 TaxID=2668068 RepID=UPI0012FB72B1|nr:hypothetical protein [Halapricum sp. CBA1109]MUV91141.1 hypothetical protein [Halapricum sp. CBA1109]